jgi:hypothetical protein
MLSLAGLFEVHHDGRSHHWVLRDWDGLIMARNGGYVTRTAVMYEIERLRVTALTANVVEVGCINDELAVDDREGLSE